MNAEVFEKKEYADEAGKVDFIRIKELKVGDKFLYNGIWRTVLSKNRFNIHYVSVCDKTNKSTLKSKSQMFVQVAK